MAAAQESKDPFGHKYVGYISGTTEASENANVSLSVVNSNDPYSDMPFCSQGKFGTLKMPSFS
jgi:hypothetical protein